MKKIAAGVLAASALTASVGLTVASTTSADAASCPRPGYTGCLGTATYLDFPNTPKANKPQKYTIKVVSGAAQPSGKLTLSLRKGGRTVYSRTKSTVFNPAGFFVKLPKGTYTVTAKFTPAANATYKPSSRTKSITLR